VSYPWEPFNHLYRDTGETSSGFVSGHPSNNSQGISAERKTVHNRTSVGSGYPGISIRHRSRTALKVAHSPSLRAVGFPAPLNSVAHRELIDQALGVFNGAPELTCSVILPYRSKRIRQEPKYD
jgi:hypothetical protein